MTEEEKQKVKEVVTELERDKAMLHYFHQRFTAFYLKFNKTSQTRYCAGSSANELEDMVKRYDSWEKKLKSLLD